MTEREQNAKRMGIPSMAELDMRDYFAAKAMQGLMSRKEQGGFDFSVYPDDAKRVAMWAYDLADAMLEARK